MTVSMRVMSAGDGYAYLLRTVVVGDGNADRLTALTRYYTAKGTPPGTWMGSGVAEFGNGELRAGMTVTPEQLQTLLGKGLDPLTGEALGRPYQRYATVEERIAAQVAKVDRSLPAREFDAKVAEITAAEVRRGPQTAVAGFDLTFAVPKSVSALWGLADAGMQEQIAVAHHTAVAEVLDLLEREVAATRVGVRGIAQVAVRGVAATTFDHYDSRANDPHLHTHVVVANRVRTVEDGEWRTLDSRALHNAVVALSEHYHAVLADRLTGVFGLGWEQRPRGVDRNPSWDVGGVPDDLVAEFSSRSRAIDVATDELVAAYVAAHGRRPTRRQIVAIRARATLATRPEKVVHSLSDLSDAWRDRARAVLGTDPARWARDILTRAEPRSFGPAGPSAADVARVARQVVEVVGEKRSTWRYWNLWAEASRQTMGWRFDTAGSREATVGRVVAEAVCQSVRLTPDEIAPTPSALQREDGSSAFRPRHTAYFTSEHHLRAEARLLDAAAALDGPTVTAAAVDRVAATDREDCLDGEQASAIRSVATSARVLDVLVGPAGAGKTTAMRALLLAWTAAHGDGSVVGLAPSAVAAGVLGADLGIACETTSKWRYEHHAGRTAFRRGQLVILDEASLARTDDLDPIVSAARTAGAKVLLVGDWAQLQSVDAGGAFSLLVQARGDDVAELTDVHRFVNEWEKEASLTLRRGDVEAADRYAGHGRLRQGTTEQMVDTAYEAWRSDLAGGKASILVTDSAESVRLLNQRARAERILDGETRAGREATLADDLRASAGDLVITRLNDRRLRTGRGGWVRNGDRWQIGRVRRDGSLDIMRAGRHGGVVTLPAWYVAEHVDLGYAVTAHRAQGVTVDTAHVVVSGSTTRENFYVAMTRGRHSNVAYVALDKPDESHAPPRPGDATAASVLYGVLHHSGRELSAHETMRAEQERWGGIAQLADEYDSIATDVVRERWTGLVRDVLTMQGQLTPSEVDDAVGGRSFGALLAELRRAEALGYDAAGLLPRVIGWQSLLGADDVGAVLSSRVARAAREPKGSGERGLIAGLVPEVRGAVPADVLAALDARRDLIAARAAALAEGAVRARVSWVRRIGEMPRGAVERERWMRRVATVAAYRDRYGITGRDPLGVDGVGIAQRRDADLARAALHEARALSPSPAQTSRERDRVCRAI